MDKVLDPQCPGLFRQNNIWMASTDKKQLCDPGCLKALCRLQEQAKTSVTGGCRTAGLAAECWQTSELQATVAHTTASATAGCLHCSVLHRLNAMMPPGDRLLTIA
jgi:hypothetical protein